MTSILEANWPSQQMGSVKQFTAAGRDKRRNRADPPGLGVGFFVFRKMPVKKTSPRTEATGPGRIPHPHEVATNHITGPAERTLSRAPQAFRGSPTAETSRRFGAVGHSLFYFGDFPGATAAPGGVRGEIELRGTRLISLY
jgi:hypothetical protein